MNTCPLILRICCILAAANIACAVFASATENNSLPPAGSYAGTIRIATSDPTTATQPAAVFSHEKHTAAVAAAGQDCSTCHKRTDNERHGGTLSYLFKDTGDTHDKTSKQAFHDSCSGCHAAYAGMGKKSGPDAAQCRACHRGASRKTNDAKADGGFDVSLHARHIRSQKIVPPADSDPALQGNCAACHHPLETTTSPQMKTDSCRSCHVGKLAHTVCISCHMKSDEKKTDGPVTCAGCHDSAAKSKQAQITPTPRLDAGQPDAVLMLPELRATEEKNRGAPRGMVKPVVFPHKTHDSRDIMCRICHHNGFAACSACHTPIGSPDGKNVTLAQAMHKPQSGRSCRGCHEKTKTQSPQCAGCHIAKPRTAKNNCSLCHVSPAGVSDAAAQNGSLLALSQQERADMAQSTLTIRRETQNVLALAAAPEQVVIDLISKEYTPVVMPHRTIITAMIAAMNKTAPQAAGLHSRNYKVCQGCHHNSGPSATPPPCVSCHAKAKKTGAHGAVSHLPLLKIAYHQQCMGCHTRMNVTTPANTDCAACHARRSNPAPQ